MVLSLKNDVPVIAIDPISGGAKITRQAEVINWPYCYQLDQLSNEQLEEAYNLCLDPSVKEVVKSSAEIGKLSARKIEMRFKDYFSNFSL